MKKQLKKLIPTSFALFIRDTRNKRHETQSLKALPPLECDVQALPTIQDHELKNVFTETDRQKDWQATVQSIERNKIPLDMGGVNPGDRRAIYYLVKHFQPRSVLEVGTHLGTSATIIALALQQLQAQHQTTHRLTTVDIKDVNDPHTQPWLQFGSQYSPRQMITDLGCADLVEFVVHDSCDYLRQGEEKFDFIFLDGSHFAVDVYQEIPFALKRLNQGGIILLHDYFPNLKPLWENNRVIYGPALAVQRLHFEGADFKVLPLGDLPWVTKKGSNITSLAILSQ